MNLEKREQLASCTSTLDFRYSFLAHLAYNIMVVLPAVKVDTSHMFIICVALKTMVFFDDLDEDVFYSLFAISFFQNGVLLRTVLDPVTGDLSDTRTRYLGSRPVKLFRVRMQGQEAVSYSNIYLLLIYARNVSIMKRYVCIYYYCVVCI